MILRRKSLFKPYLTDSNYHIHENEAYGTQSGSYVNKLTYKDPAPWVNYKPLDVNLALPEYLHIGPLPTPTYMPTILPPVKPLIIQHSYDAPSGMVLIF